MPRNDSRPVPLKVDLPTRWGNVRTVEWLPVTDGSGQRLIGLEEAFTDGHHLQRVEISAPIERAGVLRFLSSVTALIARTQNVTADTAARVARDGFDPTAVADTLDQIDDFLWLIHPATPFLQEGRFRHASSKAKNAASIRSTSPGESSKAWWGRPGDGFTTGFLSPTEAPAALAGFWFYSTNGNGKVTLGDVPVPQQGSAAGKVIAAGVRLWKTGTSLTETMLLNTPTNWIRSPEKPAWAQTLTGSGSLDPLVAATITGNATLLLPEWVEGTVMFTGAHIGGVLRTGIPLLPTDHADLAARKTENKARAAAGRETLPTPTSAVDDLKESLLFAWHEDPQVVMRKPDPKKKELTGPEAKRALNGMTASTSTLHNLHTWYLRSFNPDVPARGVLASDAFTVELFSLQLKQKGSYGELCGASWLTLPPGTIGGSPKSQQILGEFADYAYGQVRAGLYVAVRTVLGDGDAVDAALDTAVDAFNSRAEPVIEEVIALAITGEDFTETHIRAWVTAAMTAFDDAISPFANARTLPDIARARQKLFHKINQTERS